MAKIKFFRCPICGERVFDAYSLGKKMVCEEPNFPNQSIYYQLVRHSCKFLVDVEGENYAN